MAVEELSDHVEPSDMPRVLLHEVEQDPLQCCGGCAAPARPARFQPTIDLIHQLFHVVEVDGRRDYRVTAAHEVGFAAGRWSVTLPGEGAPRGAPRILRPAGRALTAVAASDDGLWFSFSGICDAPSAPVDYLALAQ